MHRPQNIDMPPSSIPYSGVSRKAAQADIALY